MGNTQAKLAASPEKTGRNANHDPLKRQASPDPADKPIKRRAIARIDEDTEHARENSTGSSRDKKPCAPLRDSLDDDEQFLELPELFDLVGAVAKKYGMDDDLLHKNYRGKDVLSCLQNRTGKWNISMTPANTYRPITLIANPVHVLHGKEHTNEIFVLGGENDEEPQWLAVSYRLDTQLPHLVLRVRIPSTDDAQNKRETVFVHIFATNLARDPKMPIRMGTGKGVIIGSKRMNRIKSARPALARKLEECLATETSLEFNRVDKGHTDVEGRLYRPIIVGNISSTELDRMAAEVVVRTDQPAHEKLLGFVHGDGIRQGLVLYTECDWKGATSEYAREANLCRIFSLAMILCNELGNFWAYRLQFPDISWTDAKFPFKDLLPPRWTVRKWLARADEAADGQAAVAASPAQWQAINRPKTLPGAEEELFLRGLDAVEDDPSSMRVLVRKDFKHDSARQTFIPRSA